MLPAVQLKLWEASEIGDAAEVKRCLDVLYAVSRARWRVVPTPGITVIGAPGAAAAAVMPGVCPGYFHICT